ncbi:MAG: bifunctional phosphoribosylaminoimidazolecarboxamide formyltransferase/IMP cyclohydrolase [Xanthomonadales bacterium]|nr:bifunctional phosphoribosylaminoimidazolecarboxamide formyltransferase/IMP cyclohydrolase [Xanthomonadales bacterium]
MTASKPLALISVSDKTGIETFARGLVAAGYELLSTGGSANCLKAANITVTDVSTYTDFPEIMGGRVKTLQALIHGGILARRGHDEAVMDSHGIRPIDVVAVNLYPFEKTISQPDCSPADAIENIDIGGPAMVRAAAKNHASVTIIVDPADYPASLAKLESGEMDLSKRRQLATKAFAHTARYDGLIAAYLSSRDEIGEETGLPGFYTPQFEQKQTMRYGENPHQRAAFYTEANPVAGSIATTEQVQGKALSFNNIADADAALEAIKLFSKLPACVIVKHANPCGVAQAESLAEAYQRAFATDPTSSFGGIIAFNRSLDTTTTKQILDQQFVEVVIAPAIDAGVAEIFASKNNIRLLLNGTWPASTPASFDIKKVNGGLLLQDRDLHQLSQADCQTVSQRAPTEAEWADLLFAWKVAQMVKSNAIVFAADGRSLGIGAGQMSRIDSARIARWKAGDAKLSLLGAAMASDAFFPFRDGIDNAADAGIKAIIQPGGSIRDDEIISAANEHDIAMVFTGIRHFRH